jgi:hypothetical protein
LNGRRLVAYLGACGTLTKLPPTVAIGNASRQVLTAERDVGQVAETHRFATRTLTLGDFFVTPVTVKRFRTEKGFRFH